PAPGPAGCGGRLRHLTISRPHHRTHQGAPTMSTSTESVTAKPSRRPGLRALGLAVLAPLLATGLAAAPVAGAQDLTDGGRLGGGSSQLLPDGVALGSLGGPELSQVENVDLERYQGTWFQVAAIPQPFTLQCTN